MTQKELIDTLEIAAAAINHIKAWDKFKEKINQLQTYKLFQNDKETYLSKQDIIDLVSEIEREENANEEKEVIENKLKEIENNEQIHRNS